MFTCNYIFKKMSLRLQLRWRQSTNKADRHMRSCDLWKKEYLGGIFVVWQKLNGLFKLYSYFFESCHCLILEARERTENGFISKETDVFHGIKQLPGNTHTLLQDGCSNCLWHQVIIFNGKIQMWRLKSNLQHNVGSPVNSGHFKPVWQTAVHTCTKWGLLIFWGFGSDKIKRLFMCRCAGDYWDGSHCPGRGIRKG